MIIFTYYHIFNYAFKEGGAMQNLIKAMKALSDETRLRIINILLQKEECCVCEVIQALDISQSRASHNLSILQNAGFLKTRRQGAWMFYSVDWQTANRYATFLSQMLKDFPINDKALEKDKQRLKRAVCAVPAALRK